MKVAYVPCYCNKDIYVWPSMDTPFPKKYHIYSHS